jgi:uncharacterized protein (TIGR00730 family)
MITVFGGASPRPGDAAYQQAQQLGRLLGQAGYTVITGGYIGTMEAVSRGAVEAGGHVIGVTCDEIEAYRPGGPNPWVIEERRTVTLLERIHQMLTAGEAALALPGGLGTLAEISIMWNLSLIKAIDPKPLILIGQDWKQTIEQFINTFQVYIPQNQIQLVRFAPDVQTAVHMLKAISYV